MFCVFFFSSRRRHTRLQGDWSSDVCSSDLSKHVHVLGIGGSAMSPLAGMLREHGFRVTGSDSGVYPPASTLLERFGILFYHSFDAAHFQPAPDLAVKIGKASGRGRV